MCICERACACDGICCNILIKKFYNDTIYNFHYDTVVVLITINSTYLYIWILHFNIELYRNKVIDAGASILREIAIVIESHECAVPNVTTKI